MEIHLKIIGALFCLLALTHIIFPKYFHWKKELPGLSLINRQIFYVHTFFIAFTVFLMGLLCLTSAEQLVESTLGHRMALGLSVFWGIRLLIQLFVYSTKLWRGNHFKTFVHIFFSFIWIYASFVFLSVGLG